MPTGPEMTKIMSRLLRMFGTVKWRVPDDFLQRGHFDRVVGSIDMTSSPGYPYIRSAPTNAILFGYKDGQLDEYKTTFVWRQVENRIKLILEEDGETDPIRLFIKAEPIKQKKFDDGKFRLISSVSIIDQILDHMLHDDMNFNIYEDWRATPCKVGWSAYIGGWKYIPQREYIATDKSAWDWTAQLWLFDICLRLRMSLCDNLTDEWVKLAIYRYSVLFKNPEYFLSGGLRLRQLNPGVMKSGCVNTIADNSIMQCILHIRVCLEMGIDVGDIWTLGDDTYQAVMPNQQEYMDRLSQYCIVKQSGRYPEFGGMLFRGPRVEPLYRGKHAFNTLHVDPKVLEQFAGSYALLYHRSIAKDFWRSLFSEMGIQLPSEEELDEIYDGED